ncbi:MAG: DUF1963 domain-containing protein [Planctomycetia bacterium]|nr:DUF1963 domain-containing protein [Planctomycetia bacterium]
MSTDLASYLSEHGLDEHREYLMGIARPSVEIITGTARVSMGCSKFGGSPELPTDFNWPQHKFGTYRFIGQVNLADIPNGRHALPSSGLLSFFYAHDENGESFWGDPDYVRVYLFDKPDALTLVEPPAAVCMGSTATLKFQLGADVPPWPWDKSAAKRWPISEDQRDAYWDLRLRLHPSRRYLLGYPFNTTLAYDPTPGPEWRSFLTVSSNDELEWCWHDGDWLVTFIEEHRLRAGDFSEIKSDAG